MTILRICTSLQEDIAYLRGRNLFSEEFLDYLRGLPFHRRHLRHAGGNPGVSPVSRMVIVRAPAIEAQLIETFTLLTINHQSLIATKANRIARAAQWPHGAGVRLPPGAGRGCRHHRRPCGLHRRLSPVRPAPSLTRSTAFPPAAPWPMPGCRCSTRSMTPSRPTARSIPTTPRCWWIPTIP